MTRLLPCAALVLACGGTASTGTDTQTLVAIAALPGGGSNSAVAINARGDVAGASTTSDVQRAYLSAGGRVTGLPLLQGLSSASFGEAFGVNASDQVVGDAVDSLPHAALWMNDQAIALAPASASGAARGINASGQIAGEVTSTSGVTSAFLWTPATANGSTGQLVTLPDLGSSYATAYGLNDAGAVVGAALTASGALHATLWVNGKITDLGTLGGTSSTARAVNAAGVVVGSAEIQGSSVSHAFSSSAGHMVDLGTCPSAGATEARANAVNAAGVVVGTCFYTSGRVINRRAFVSGNGHLLDLNARLPASSGWTLYEANAINDAGVVAGTGLYNGVERAFALRLD